MALADYFSRSEQAAAQVVRGFDSDAFRAALDRAPIGISIGKNADTFEGRLIVELAIRIVSRLYPRLELHGNPGTDGVLAEAADLARAINPKIEVAETSLAQAGIGIGNPSIRFPVTTFAGSKGWDSLISTKRPQPVSRSRNPFGAGAAACLAAANLFRHVLLRATPDCLDQNLILSTLDLEPRATQDPPKNDWSIGQSAVLVGAGAIGNAAIWALARSPLSGRIHLVDPEDVELSNLQRYVLARRDDVNRPKVDLGAEQFAGARSLDAIGHHCDWAGFVEQEGHDWSQVLVALDSAAGRRAVQAALPEWVANAWTQPGDLGVSDHVFGGGACVSCLYLPSGPTLNDDRRIGAALGLGEEYDARLRLLLHTNEPVPPDLLMIIAQHLGREPGLLLAFQGRALRELYVEGICGGGVLPLGEAGAPHQDIHVPLAHQSALAGILLAATLVRRSLGRNPERTTICRLDVLRPVPDYISQLASEDPRGICICQDSDYRATYRRKYPR